jgi:hypothetical protein
MATHNTQGVRCQCSGVSFLKTEVRRQPAMSQSAVSSRPNGSVESKTDCKKLEEEFNLNSVICHLFTDTRHLKPETYLFLTPDTRHLKPTYY